MSRLMWVMPIALLLAGCGGGNVMESYSGEKARLRGLLPGTITCEENGSQTRMSCTTGDGNGAFAASSFYAELKAEDGRALQVTIVSTAAMYDALFDGLAAAYGLSRDDIERCRNIAQVERAERTHSVDCINRSVQTAMFSEQMVSQLVLTVRQRNVV